MSVEIALTDTVQNYLIKGGITMRWQSKLTKKELQHVKETTERGTLSEFRRNFEAQEKHRTADYEPCYDCWFIAKKLGLRG